MAMAKELGTKRALCIVQVIVVLFIITGGVVNYINKSMVRGYITLHGCQILSLRSAQCIELGESSYRGEGFTEERHLKIGNICTDIQPSSSYP